MTRHEFAYLARVLKETSGLNLGPDKEALLEARLLRLLKERNLDSIPALCTALLRADGERLRLRLAEVMTIHESYFFRDKAIFACFADDLLPKLMEAHAQVRQLRFWCAASATGQEPYSLAMLLHESRDRLQGWKIEILATDFSEDALARARSGYYTQFEVQRGLPVRLLIKYFRRAGPGWEIDPAIRSMVNFRQHNLLHDSARLGVFDAVFCRNVMMYFDDPTKCAVLDRLSQQIADGGYLLLGATETVLGRSPAFGPLATPCPGVFRLLGRGQVGAFPVSPTYLAPAEPAPIASEAPIYASR